jgi:ABC-2 type transport system ATP-binding protein
LIQARNLSRRFGSVMAVDGISLDVPAGSVLALLGPNGAGKTTTIEILEGLLAPTSGTVELLGRKWDREERELRQLLGISLQETRLAEKLTVEETLRLFASFYAHPRPYREVMEELALVEKAGTWVGKLSGGQRQRLAVATALVAKPKILFLDEPTTGLDPQSRRQLWEIIRQFQANGGTVLLTTHYMDEAEKLCDRLVIVDYGKIIAAGTPQELIAKLGGAFVIEFAAKSMNGALSTETWRRVPGVESVSEQDGLISLRVRELYQSLPALLASVEANRAELLHLNTRQATLEDVFVGLTGRHLREA